MNRFRSCLVACAGLLLGLHGPTEAQGDKPAAAPHHRKDAQTLANQLDRFIGDSLQEAGVQPAPLADDAEFLRRVYLDLAGRIPAIAEARQFLDDKAGDKRMALIDRLLNSPRYVMHFGNFWRNLWISEVPDPERPTFLGAFDAWLHKHLHNNTGYDQIVRELLTTPVAPEGGLPDMPFRPSGALAFYQAKENKPENLAAGVSRFFLGIKLECAQCHHHPFADWKREQFWGMAAFFAGVPAEGQRGKERLDRRELVIPGTERVVQAGFLDGTEPQWKFKVGPRVTLADWLTSADNPYFARAAANRLWAYFFGTGIIDPVDEMAGGDAKASHPALLDELGRQFAAHKFDLKFLIRAITYSKAYQRASAGSDRSTRLFGRMALRGMSPEQLFDSVAEATLYQERGRTDRRVVALGGKTPRTEFLEKFANFSEKATETETSIIQALAFMNGKLIADATSLERSEMLSAVAEAPFLDTAGRIEALFLATLSRKPRTKESERFVHYVERGGATPQEQPSAAAQKRALGDVFWVLLNSSEFLLNH